MAAEHQTKKVDIKIGNQTYKITAKLKNEIEEIENMLDKDEVSNLVTKWKVGQKMDYIANDPTGIYGDNPLEVINSLLESRYSKSFGYKLLMFYRRFSSKQELDKLLSYRIRGKPITWRIIDLLLTVDDQQKLWAYIEWASTTSATYNELEYLIRSEQGGPEKPSSGRKPTIPKGFVNLLYSLQSYIRMTLSKCQKVWLCSKNGLKAQFEPSKEKDLNEVYNNIIRAESSLELLCDTLNSIRDVLNELCNTLVQQYPIRSGNSKKTDDYNDDDSSQEPGCPDSDDESPLEDDIGPEEKMTSKMKLYKS